MRKITSLILVVSGLVELVTSVVLYIIPAGRVAYWSDYHLMGLSKTQWGDIHLTVGTLFLVMAGLHIYYNWGPITAYLKNRAKKLVVFNRNFSIACLATLYVGVGTLYHLPPMNYVLQFGEYLTDEGNKKYGEPPYGHAELSSLKMFCSKMNIDLGEAMAKLMAAGIDMSGPQDTLVDIAKKNGKTPQQIYEIFKPAPVLTEAGVQVFPDSPAPGFGNNTIATICETYGLSCPDVLTALGQAGFPGQEGSTIKEIAAEHDASAMAVFEVIKGVAQAAK